MSTNTDFTTSSAMSTPREIGYAVVSGGDQAGSPIALVLPSGCVPQNVRVDVAREVVNLDTLSGPAFLRGTPLALRKALQRADSTVTIFTVDTLTEIQAVWSKEQVHVREMGDAGIRDALNSFLGRIAAGQSAEATKHRVRFRHPEIEAFIRKMLATLAKAAPKLQDPGARSRHQAAVREPDWSGKRCHAVAQRNVAAFSFGRSLRGL